MLEQFTQESVGEGNMDERILNNKSSSDSFKGELDN